MGKNLAGGGANLCCDGEFIFGGGSGIKRTVGVYFASAARAELSVNICSMIIIICQRIKNLNLFPKNLLTDFL